MAFRFTRMGKGGAIIGTQEGNTTDVKLSDLKEQIDKQNKRLENAVREFKASNDVSVDPKISRLLQTEQEIQKERL